LGMAHINAVSNEIGATVARAVLAVVVVVNRFKCRNPSPTRVESMSRMDCVVPDDFHGWLVSLELNSYLMYTSRL